jgi:hypothetical protein
MRRQKKYHFIYRTTCQITGKFYVGMHSTDNLEDGYLGSGKILGYSRKKHGDENHKKEIIEMCTDREALKLREKEIVNEKLLVDPLNINLKYGGEGGWDQPLLQSVRGKKGATKGNAAKAILRKTDPIWAMAESQRNSNITRSAYANGTKAINLPDWNGRSHCAETKQKIGKANSIHQSGTGNSQYGTCWVTNGVPKKIKKQDLDSYLSSGYIRGRSMPS